VHRSFRATPFFLLLPLNTQPARLTHLNLEALPGKASPPPVGVGDPGVLDEAVRLIRSHRRIVCKVGGGARAFPHPVRRLIEAVGGVAALSPGALGVVPDAHPQNMGVSGSKGSMSGNYATEHADLLIVIGSRGVCQADCSGTAFASVDAVINLNADLGDVAHYNRTVALPGDIGVVIPQLLEALHKAGGIAETQAAAWLAACAAKKLEWQTFKATRYARPTLYDPVWGREVLTQPAAIKTAAAWAKARGAVKFFDAGDVQAAGFQVVEDDWPNQTVTETGASYMGFAVSALLASGLADRPKLGVAFTGDGSFFMNPQVLVDGVLHGAQGIILLLDNRRMGAISGLQEAQYGLEFCTADGLAIDYLQLAGAVPGVRAFAGGDTPEALEAALDGAGRYTGLSLVHVPVYYGPDPLGGLGAYGVWNVGNWCETVQARYHAQDI
jgi:3D-(3,5/4)-trihydroxycyclohexane-1,2-dione acylhydrolase (decyclizing)